MSHFNCQRQFFRCTRMFHRKSVRKACEEYIPCCSKPNMLTKPTTNQLVTWFNMTSADIEYNISYQSFSSFESTFSGQRLPQGLLENTEHRGHLTFPSFSQFKTRRRIRKILVGSFPGDYSYLSMRSTSLPLLLDNGSSAILLIPSGCLTRQI